LVLAAIVIFVPFIVKKILAFKRELESLWVM
jgi:hypothetical protein